MCVGVLDDQSRDALWFTHGDTQGHGRAAVVHVHEAITDVEMNEQFVNGGGVTVERGMRQHVGATLPGQIRSDDVGNLCEWADHVAERVGRAREPVDQEHRRSARITSRKVGRLGAFGQRERRRTGPGCIDLTSLAVATSGEPTPRPRSPHILRRSERCRTGSLPDRPAPSNHSHRRCGDRRSGQRQERAPARSLRWGRRSASATSAPSGRGSPHVDDARSAPSPSTSPAPA
jgi:hypothetical protein